MRGMASEFRGHVDEMVRQSELDDVKKQLEASPGLDLQSLDPTKQIKSAIQEGMAAELRCHAAHLGHPLAPAAQHAWQFLGADHDQCNDRDDQKLRTVDTEHRRSCLPQTDERH